MSNKNFGVGTKGIIMILVLIAAAIAVTSLLYHQSSNSVQEVSLQEPIVENLAASTQPSSEEPAGSSVPAGSVKATVPSSTQSTQASAASDAEEPAVRRTLQTAYPVQGNTIGEYAMDCLSYNETTRDWRVHNGIDLAAEAGTPVCAAADGTVYTTYEDDTLGYTVVIQHEGGYTTRYSSLTEDLCVNAGDAVELGQTIGYAGDSALVETVMGSHVHFSVSCQDVPMDPVEFLALS